MSLDNVNTQRIVALVGTQADVESADAELRQARIAYATDIDAFGFWDGTAWVWPMGNGTGGGGPTGSTGHWELEMAEGITSPPEAETTEDGTDVVYGWVTDE